MPDHRRWVQRDLGFNPIAMPPTHEIIDFDSGSPGDRVFLTFSAAPGLSRFMDIPWARGTRAQDRAEAEGQRDHLLGQHRGGGRGGTAMRPRFPLAHR